MQIREGLTFNDVLLVPKYSDVESRRKLSVKTQLSKNLTLNIPIMSANMDTVTEYKMAICMAELGGIGIIHRYLPIEEQAEQVRKVKRAHNFIISEPYSISENADLDELRMAMKKYEVKSLLAIDNEGRLKGIISKKDLLFEISENTVVKNLMTNIENLVYKIAESLSELDFNQMYTMLKEHKVKQIPVVNQEMKVLGLVTLKDVEKRLNFPDALKDHKGRLRVGAAVGVINDYLERTAELVKAGVDVLVIDIAHGHSKHTIEAIKNIKKDFPNVDVIAGNVATAEATRDLILAGADSIKVGIGPGSTCSTRIVTGCGVPQLTAVVDCYNAAKEYNIPVIADGGIRTSGDIVKALAAGASSVMIGGMLAGCEESPGHTRVRDGQKVKIYRGMASYDAVANRKQKESGYKIEMSEYTPEGVETITPYKGYVSEVISQLVGGIRSGMSYIGTTSVPEMVKNAEFIRITSSGWNESIPHALK